MKPVPGTPSPGTAPISWAHPTEMLDPRPHVRAASLVCTLGSALHDADSCFRFVQAVADAGPSGICLGLGEVHLEVPDGLVRACRDFTVPLVTVPFGVSFSQINEIVLESRLANLSGSSHGAAHARSLHVGHLLTLIADGLAEPGAVLLDLRSVARGDQAVVVSAWPPGVRERLERTLVPALIGEVGDVTLAVTRHDLPVREHAAQLSLACGVSAPVQVRSVGRAVNEARIAARIAWRRGLVVGAEELTTLDALLAQLPSRRLRPFIDHVIVPIQGTRGGSQLLSTLRQFIAADGSPQTTAKREYLHVNTVRYRLRQIHDITDKDPFTHEGLSDLRIALWALDHSPSRDSEAQPSD
ncbi:PucR family transcriptional regulator ligand-binding domain-containing protein [Pseudactinotalea sp. Z1739]|uniref:helix-turn-helix domain-containing protein n=1 Tax=Pseudactinotalea sp. Z1739 TaxID=3413028 RepID=UPI003C799719